MWTLVHDRRTVGFGTLLCRARVSRWDRSILHERLSFDPTAHQPAGVFLAQLAIGVLGVLVISSEYATGLIRTTLTAVPNASDPAAAKVLVFAVSPSSCDARRVRAFFVGQTILASKERRRCAPDPGVLRAVLGAALPHVDRAARRSRSARSSPHRGCDRHAVRARARAARPVDALPSPWNTDVGKVLPINAGHAMFTVRPNSDLLSPLGGLIALLVTVGVVLALATVVIQRRDA